MFISKLMLNALKLLEEIQKLGYEAYIVGGAVRDLLLDRQIKDVDIATNCPLNILEKNFVTYSIGKSKTFGICLVRYEGEEYEIAQFRADGQYSDNRKPDSVEIGVSLREDLSRRDFTVNAMALDINGRIIDFFNGMSDLESRILRTVGNPEERFQEDYLRMIRAARFASLGFRVEAKTRLAIRKLSSKCKFITPERIQMEFEKASKYGSKEFATFIQTLSDLRILSKILPEVNCLKYYSHLKKHHPEGGVWQHTLEALKLSKPDFKIHIGVLLHDIGKPAQMDEYPLAYKGHDKAGAEIAKAVLKRLRFSNEFISEIEFVVKNHMKFFVLPLMKRSKILKFVDSPYFETLYEVAKADHGAKLGHPVEKFVEIDLKIAEEKSKPLPPPKIVDGDFIMELTGEKPGPIIGKIKKQVSEKVINENLPTTEATLKRCILESWEALK